MMQLRDGWEKLSFSKVSFCRPSRAPLGAAAAELDPIPSIFFSIFFFFPRKKGTGRAAEQSCAGRTLGGRALGSGCPPRGGREAGSAGAAPLRERAEGAPHRDKGAAEAGGRTKEPAEPGAAPRGMRPPSPGLPAGPAPPARGGGARGRGPSSHAQLPATPRRAGEERADPRRHPAPRPGDPAAHPSAPSPRLRPGSGPVGPDPRCTYPAAAAPRGELARSCRAGGDRAAGPLLFFTVLSSSLPPSLLP